MPSGTAPRPGPLARAIGERMKAKMAIERLTLNDVAPEVGVSASQLSKLLLAWRGITIEQLDRLAWSLGTDIETVIIESSQATSKRRAHWPVLLKAPRTSGGTFHLAGYGEADPRFVRKIRYLIDAHRPRVPPAELHHDLAAACSSAGILLSLAQWEDVMGGQINPRSSWVDLLTPLADFFGVPDDYLRLDDTDLDDRIEADLRFESAMHDLGVQRVAARSSGTPSADEVLDITETVSRAVDALRKLRDRG